MRVGKIVYSNNVLPNSSLKKQRSFSDTEFNSNKMSMAQYSSENVKANFMPSFKGIYSDFENDNFLNLLDRTKVYGQSLLSQLKDRSFETDENFDISEWVGFLTLFDIKNPDDGKTYLESFLKKTTFPKFFYSEDCCPTDIIELINDMRNPISSTDFKKLFQIIDLISDVDSSNYNEKERIRTLRYFLDLEDKNGNKIFGVANPRNSKISTLEFLINIDPTSVDASNLQMLLELVSNGVVGNHIFEFLPKNGKFSSLVINDIDKLYSAYISGIEPVDAFVPTYKSKQIAQKELNIGDVYEVENEENIYIKTKDDESSQLKMTKQKYFELFPPIERFSTTQNLIGNCWEISVLQGMFANPETRNMVLNLFSQQGNDIIVRFPFSEAGDIIFSNSELPAGENSDDYSKGAKGFTLLEYADGKELQAGKIKQYRFQLETMKDENPQKYQQKNLELEELLSKGQENIDISYDRKSGEYKITPFGTKSLEYKNAEVMGRDGGSPLEFFVRLGFKNINEFILDEKDCEEFLFNPESFKSNIVILTTKDIDFSFENSDMVDGHAYLISGVNFDENAKVVSFNIVNPWGIVEQTLTYEELKKYGAAISYANNLDEDCL